MGSIYNEIERIENAKSDIETAIEECGVNVPDTELIDTYSTYVRQIPSAVFSSFNIDIAGGTDKYIQSIKQINGLIETTVGGLVSTSSSGLVPKADASSGVIDTQSTDWVLTNKNGTVDWYKLPESAYKNDKVTQTVTSTSNVSWRPILLGYSYSDSDPFAPTTVTNTVYASRLLKVQPSTGTLQATQFIGNLQGVATSTNKLNKVTGETPSVCATAGNSLTYYTLIRTTADDGNRYAGDNTGFPVSSNANSILWLGNHPNSSDSTKAGYGGQIGISSNGNIYYRFITNGNFPTTANGGSWKRLAFTTNTYPTSQITALTGYAKALEPSDLVTTDTLNIALGKLETKADLGIIAYNWYKSVTEEDTDTVINKWDEIVDFINSVTEGTDIIDEFVTRKTNQQITGIKTFYTSRNDAPFNVTSSTVVTNLNADLLDGKHASDFALTTDVPTVTDYYWANINIKDSSDITTTPIFGTVTTSACHIQSASTGIVTIQCPDNLSKGVILNLPSVTGQLVCHRNDTAVGSTNNPVYVAATGYVTACTVSANTSNTLYLVGVTSSTSGFYSGTQSTAGVRITGGNTLYAYGGFFESSDNRLKNFKENINVNLEKLSKLPKKYFTWKNDSKLNIGTSAQELQKLYPELVSEDDEGLLNVAYDKLSIIALAAIDKLYEENNLLKSKIISLENKIQNLEELISLNYGNDN